MGLFFSVYLKDSVWFHRFSLLAVHVQNGHKTTENSFPDFNNAWELSQYIPTETLQMHLPQKRKGRMNSASNLSSGDL